MKYSARILLCCVSEHDSDQADSKAAFRGIKSKFYTNKFNIFKPLGSNQSELQGQSLTHKHSTPISSLACAFLCAELQGMCVSVR